MKYAFLFFVFIGFSTFAQKTSLTFNTHLPYCGGARPTPEMAKGTTAPAAGQKFALIRVGGTKVKWITLNDKGQWKGRLKKGTYNIYREEKRMTIVEIKSKHKLSSSELVQYKGDECITEYCNTPDFKMEITGNAEFTFTINGKCNIGFRPCLEYVGPLAP